MSTIIAWLYIRNNRYLPKKIARILLCAILSDTLNLKSATTAKADEFAVALLAKFGEVCGVGSPPSRPPSLRASFRDNRPAESSRRAAGRLPETTLKSRSGSEESGLVKNASNAVSDPASKLPVDASSRLPVDAIRLRFAAGSQPFDAFCRAAARSRRI